MPPLRTSDLGRGLFLRFGSVPLTAKRRNPSACTEASGDASLRADDLNAVPICRYFAPAVRRGIFLKQFPSALRQE